MPKLHGHFNDILHAVRQNNVDLIKHLMTHKAKTKDKPSFPFSSCLVESQGPQYKEDIERIVLEATSLDDPTILSYLIKQGVSVNFCAKFVIGGITESKTTPLHLAVDRKLYETMDVLIGANANVNLGDSKGHSPLHLACQGCDVIATRLLVCSAADTGVVDRQGTTPLQVASTFGHVDLVRALLEHNAQIFQEKQRGHSPLHIAATEGHIPLLDMFARYVDIDIQTEATALCPASSPIHLACGRGLLETVRFIVERFGANVNVLDSLGNSPLHCVVKSKHNHKQMRKKEDFTALVDYLIKKKVVINLQNHNGCTPLHLAAQNGFQKCVESLLMSGADPLVTNEAGMTSRDLIPTYDAAMKQTFVRCAPFSNAYIALSKVVNDNGASVPRMQVLQTTSAVSMPCRQDVHTANSHGRPSEEKQTTNKRENLLGSELVTETCQVQVYKTLVQTSYDL